MLLIAHGLKMAKSKTKQTESLFRAFDPSNYTEIDQYSFNPVFQCGDIKPLLNLANKALVYFTRADSEYYDDTKARNSFISAKRKRELKKHNEVAFPFFSMVPFKAFKRKKSDFEEAVKFCIDNINTSNEEDVKLHNIHTLDETLRNEIFESKGPFQINGNQYDRPHLLSAFALWKIDKAIIALQDNKASNAVNFVIVAQEALDIACECYKQREDVLFKQKKASERQASIGGKSHKNLNIIKDKVLKIYVDQGKTKKWKSVRKASQEIFILLDKQEKKLFVSQEGAEKTIWDWISSFDPKGNYSEYKKKVPVNRPT